MSGYRLSPQQARLWSQLGDDAPRLRARCLVRLDGPLDRPRLHAALVALTTAHEILRTDYRPLAGTSTGVQSPRPPDAAPEWRVVAPAGADVDARLAAFVDEARAMATTAPFAATLAPLADDCHALMLDVPALSADRRGLANLARAIVAGYDGAVVAAAPLQYADVAAVFNDLLDADDSESGRRHWREQPIEPYVDVTLPGDDATAREFQPRSLPVPLPCSELEAAARAAGVTAAEWLCAAWQALVARSTGRDEPSVALSFDGRAYDSLDVALGRFERALPVGAAAIDRTQGCDRLAQATARAAAQASEWQDYFDLARALPATAATPTTAPRAFRLGFAQLAWPAPATAGELRAQVLALDAVSDVFELQLVCAERADGLTAELVYDAGRRSAADVARLSERLVCLLTAASAAPATPIAALPIVGAAEAAQLAAWNETTRAWPIDDCVHARFEAQARRTPDRVALSHGDEQLTYAELWARANRLAQHLRTLGIAGEARVGLCLERSPAQIVALLAILKAGGAYVPLDPMLPSQRLAYMLEQAEVTCVVTQQSLRAALPAGARLVTLDDAADAAAIAAAPAVAPTGAADPRALAYVIFTSGSTGRPKGVMIEHRSVVNLWHALHEAVYAGRGDGLRVSLNAPLAFDASVKQWVQLLSGHTLCVVPEEARPDPARLAQLAQRERIDVLDCTPSLLAGLVERGLGRQWTPALVLVGGEAIAPPLWQALAAAKGTTFVNVYGPTECTVDTTAGVVTAATAPTIGRPLGNVRVHVLDEALRPVPIGVVGELCIGGAGVARGYVGQPALTAERFVAGGDGTRLYRSGDLARLRDDGNIELLGRADGQIKLRGLRIELGEIEAALRAQPDVRDAVVIARAATTGEVQLIGYVVVTPAADDAAAPAELRAALRRTLPEYMVPAALVALPSLPLTSNGKLDRAALPDPDSIAAAPYVPPASDVERTVAAIWQEVLGVAKVGLHDNFFDLGGHSLLTVRVHEKLTQAFARPFSMVELFRHPTVDALSRYIAGTDATAGADAAGQAERQRAARARQAQRNKAGRGPR
ncbi:MAG TPA: amino acid adenylation domain-containing protein [Polyangia bacterium]|nr:amino acid adenylation domain-containing protein [Polyangia bacterium]